MIKLKSIKDLLTNNLYKDIEYKIYKQTDVIPWVAADHGVFRPVTCVSSIRHAVVIEYRSKG